MVQLNKPDPRFLHSPAAKKNFALAIKITLWLVAILWAILIIDSVLGLRLGRFGLRPGSIQGLIGVITAPLLHGGAEHLFTNTLPLIVGLTFALYLYPRSCVSALPLIWLGSGILAWMIGRPSLHYGASGFIYGVLAFVFISGLLRSDMRSVGVSLIIWFLYGSMIWGVLPIRPHMSWELHLTGAIMGVFAAILFRQRDHTPVKRYDWEDDDTVPDWYPEQSDGLGPESQIYSEDRDDDTGRHH